MNNDDLSEQVRALHAKLDRVLAILEEMNAPRSTTSPPKAPKEKPVPLTEQDIAQFQKQFAELFSRWLEGYEQEAQDILEALDADQLRRFADANNLNVTAKMPKAKVLQLIGARFREKRQLHRTRPTRDGEDA